MKPKVYLETTIVSYLTARPSRDLIIAAHQQITREWWEKRRGELDLFVSQIVLKEAAAGDEAAAAERLELLNSLPVLEITENATLLAEQIQKTVPLPERAAADALHIALAVVHGVDFLVTWNCRHIANAALRQRIEAVCTATGYGAPVICTPEELLEG